ncbi:MAG: hypothetical protein WD004_06115 [Actinomycetota bacterium]
MLVLISHLIRADHEEVDGLVREGFRGIGKDGVEVQVVATRSPTRFTGKAWPEPPARRVTGPETRWLVEIVMPARPPVDGYPIEWRYPRLKTAPVFTAHDWRDRVFTVVAHEAYHVKQFRMGMRRSEVAAERWAFRALERVRASDGRSGS